MAECVVELWHDGQFIDSKKCTNRRDMYEFISNCKKRYKLNHYCYFDVKGFENISLKKQINYDNQNI